MQTTLVTVIALAALATIVRRFSDSWLPAAFRPARKPSGCDSCPIRPADV